MTPNVGRPRRRLSVGRVLLTIPLLIGLIALGSVDPGIWTLVGWTVLAGVLAGILHAVAPQHAGWPVALLALGTVAENWQAPWGAVTSGMALPWILLALLGEIGFAVLAVAGLRYSQLCSQLRQPATLRGYRVYAAQEVPRFVKRVIRALSKYRIERVR